MRKKEISFFDVDRFEEYYWNGDGMLKERLLLLELGTK